MNPRPWTTPDLQQPGTGPVVRLLDLALSEAVRAGAHTIEFRPTDGSGLVLWDLEGTLTPCMQVPPDAYSLLVGRLKALLGHAPGAPGPVEGALAFSAKGAAAQLNVRVAPGLQGREAATVQVVEVTNPGRSQAAT